VALGQSPKPNPAKEASTPEQDVEKLLANPLEGDSLKALPDQIQGVQSDSKSRNRHPLKENSEPYIVFLAMKRDVKTWASPVK